MWFSTYQELNRKLSPLRLIWKSSKATEKWRATYEGLGTYSKVPNLSKGPSEPTVQCGSPLIKSLIENYLKILPHYWWKTVLTSKATGKWRVTYEGPGTYSKVPNLIQRAFQPNSTVWFSKSQGLPQKANTPKSNKVTLKFFQFISGRQYRLRIPNLQRHIVLYAARC